MAGHGAGGALSFYIKNQLRALMALYVGGLGIEGLAGSLSRGRSDGQRVANVHEGLEQLEENNIPRARLACNPLPTPRWEEVRVGSPPGPLDRALPRDEAGERSSQKQEQQQLPHGP